MNSLLHWFSYRLSSPRYFRRHTAASSVFANGSISRRCHSNFQAWCARFIRWWSCDCHVLVQFQFCDIKWWIITCESGGFWYHQSARSLAWRRPVFCYMTGWYRIIYCYRSIRSWWYCRELSYCWAELLQPLKPLQVQMAMQAPTYNLGKQEKLWKTELQQQNSAASNQKPKVDHVTENKEANRSLKKQIHSFSTNFK